MRGCFCCRLIFVADTDVIFGIGTDVGIVYDIDVVVEIDMAIEIDIDVGILVLLLLVLIFVGDVDTTFDIYRCC